MLVTGPTERARKQRAAIVDLGQTRAKRSFHSSMLTASPRLIRRQMLFMVVTSSHSLFGFSLFLSCYQQLKTVADSVGC